MGTPLGSCPGFHHIPVLLQETLQALDPKPGGTYLDCTVGGGGHSYEILRRTAPDGRLIGIDQDREALRSAGERLKEFGDRVRLVHGNFGDLAEILRKDEVLREDLIKGSAAGALFDLGVSSYQLDEGERGFSYHQDAPLDMRMDPDRGRPASDLIKDLSEAELAGIIREYGEERWASRIAQFIVRRRPIRTTGELVEAVKAAIPAAARRTGPHPARRTFQAIRIAVNDELGALERGLRAAVDILNPGGRIAVITFHSLEDRIVKRIFAEMARGCQCPPGTPVCVCGGEPLLALINRKPVVASEEELEQNPRSRSAKLRAAERLIRTER